MVAQNVFKTPELVLL